MFEVIIIIVAIFLSIIGLSELMHRLWIILIRPNKSKNILITLLRDEFAVEQVTAALEEMRWHGKNCAVTLIGVDMGLEQSLADTCRRMQEDNDDFVFTTEENITEIIKKRS